MQAHLKIVTILLLLYCLVAFSNFTEKLKPRLVRLMAQDANSFRYFDSGYEGKQEHVPYMVALEFNGRGSKWFCSGSILDHKWIVTVASCTNPASYVNITFGAANRLESLSHVLVSNQSFYPRWDFNRYYHHDIALIKVPHINYTKQVKPVQLPKTLSLFKETWAQSAGWGQHKDNNQLMSQLYVVQMQVESNDHCINSGYGDRFKPEMLCAQLPNMETSCHLDSGSPLVILQPTTLIGIASFGNQLGCKSNKPLGYTRINSYMKWMFQVMADNRK